MKEKLIDWLNWLLVADLFLVLLSFAWFAIAILGRATRVSLGLEVWYSLWNPLFMPAISILMAGALASGAISWVSKRLEQRGS
jgi:hypothetical protein